jgi:hypothetical protein
MDSEFCGQMFDSYSFPVYHEFFERVLDPNYICTEIALCDDIFFFQEYKEAYEQ